MNNLEAFVIVRNCALVSQQLRTRQGRAALKVVDRKIQSLLRKKAWREGGGATPVHMGRADFTYRISDDPVTAALRRLMAAQDASIEKFTAVEIDGIEAAMADGRRVLAELDQENGVQP